MAVIQCIVNELRTQRSPFDYNFHNRVNTRAQGLYVFWLHNRCLYVGMSNNISRRIYRHRINEHNAELAQYFKAFSRNIQVSYVDLKDKQGIELRRLERKVINILRPATNIA